MITYQNHTENINTAQLTGFFVGWPNPPSPETFLKMLRQSSSVVLARDTETGNVIGFINAISDGVLCAYIPLLEVLPPYQKQGIGQELVQRMLKTLRNYYMIDLICDDNLVGFYERLGLRRLNGMILRNYDRQSGSRD